MEKISLLLLLVKKTLIGSVIAGILGYSGISTSFFHETQEKENSKKIEREGSVRPGRQGPGRM